jgi:hypothetical protein
VKGAVPVVVLNKKIKIQDLEDENVRIYHLKRFFVIGNVFQRHFHGVLKGWSFCLEG